MNDASSAAESPDSAPATPVAAAAPPPPDPTDSGFVLRTIETPLDEKKFKAALVEHLNALIRKHKVEEYEVLFLYDEADEISTWKTVTKRH